MTQCIPTNFKRSFFVNIKNLLLFKQLFDDFPFIELFTVRLSNPDLEVKFSSMKELGKLAEAGQDISVALEPLIGLFSCEERAYGESRRSKRFPMKFKHDLMKRDMGMPLHTQAALTIGQALANEKTREKTYALLLQAFESDNETVRWSAARAFGAAADSGASISFAFEELMTQIKPDELKDYNQATTITIMALEKAAENGEDLTSVLPVFLKLFSSDLIITNHSLFGIFTYSLLHPQKKEEVIELLTTTFENGCKTTQANVLRVFESAASKGVAHEIYCPLLIKLMRHFDSHIKQEAFNILISAIEKGYAVDFSEVKSILDERVESASNKGEKAFAQAKRKMKRDYYTLLRALRRQKQGMQEGVLLAAKPKPPVGKKPQMLRVRRIRNG